MECPSCGRDNSPDRLECQYCETLLVDVFAAGEDDKSKNEKTDPISRIGLSKSVSTDFETAYSRRFAATQYTGDLPRLFRFGDRYQILEKLGEGGMGRVYKALDLELDRPVALKTIRAEKGTGPDILKRFKQELLLARKVTHKNVVRIYDLGEAEGMKFFTMELIEGKSLRDELKERGRIPAKEAIAFLKQMLAGLTEAHGQGVVHRDLKPQNIMIDANGNVRIMDFGIARTADTATLTGTDEMMGTPDYISPEQVRGENADAQSDLYSLGVILYEMLTGEVPFKGDNAVSKIVARIQVKPSSPRSLCADIPAYVERIVLKLMEMDTDLRYKTAEEVLQDIEREQVDRSILLRARKLVSRHRGWIAAACIASSVGLAVWLYPLSVTSAHPVTTIAILPFENKADDPDFEWFEEGLADMLVTDISQSRSLRPVLTERMQRILDTLGKQNERTLDEQSLAVVAELSKADYTLAGAFYRNGDDLRVDLRLQEANSPVVRSIAVHGDAAKAFTLVDEITERVSQALEISSDQGTDLPLVDVSTDKLGAFRAYHQGLRELQSGRSQSAVDLFREALELDQNFAMAHARLAEAYFNIGSDGDASREIRLALSIATANPLPDAEQYQLYAIASRIHDDPQTAVENYRKLLSLYPEDPGVLLSLASSLETLGQVDEATKTYREVLDKAPDYGAAVLGLGRMLVIGSHRDDAIQLLQSSVASGMFKGNAEALGMVHSILGVAYDESGMHAPAIVELENSLRYRQQIGDLGGEAATLTNLALVHVSQGDLERARPLLERSLEIARSSDNSTMESFALVNLAYLYENAGELEKALEIYRESLEIEWERKEHTELADRLNYMGHLYALLGRYADAMVYLEQAKVHIEVSSEPAERGSNSLHRGSIFRAKGLFNEAQAALLNAISAFDEAHKPEGAAQAQDELFLIYLTQGRLREARSAIERSEQLSAEVRLPRLEATALLHAAIFMARIGAEDGAREKLRRGKDKLAGMKSHSLQPLAALAEAEVLVGGSEKAALDAWTQAYQISKARGDFLSTLDAGAELGAQIARSGRYSEATRLLETCLEEAERRRLPVAAARAALSLAAVRMRGGDLELAHSALDEALKRAEDFQGTPMLQRGYALAAALAEAEKRTADAQRARARASELEQLLNEQKVALLTASHTAKHD